MYRILLVILFALLCSCTVRFPEVRQLAPMPADAACRVSLLPLVDKSSFPQGGQLLYKIFTAELVSSGKFKVLEEGDILELYRQFKIYPNRMPSGEELKMLGNRSGTTLFIGGDLLKMTENQKGGFVETEVTVVLRLYDGSTGQLLWSTYHHRRGNEYQKILHFGQVGTVTELVKIMSQEIINLWLDKGIQSCAG